MDYLNVNERMLEMRINEKKSKSYSKIAINGADDGFSMLTTKNMTGYVDLLEVVNTTPPEERFWEHT